MGGGGRSGATIASKRLMKEARTVQRSAALEGVIQLPVEFADDNILEWTVHMLADGLDPDCNLRKELMELKQQTAGEVDSICLRISFPDDYPFSPPFVRIAAPYVVGGYVQRGGALCAELLTSDGWAQAYSMEAVLVQVANTLTHPRTGIAKKAPAEYTEARARQAHRAISAYHAQHGWASPPPQMG